MSELLKALLRRIGIPAVMPNPNDYTDWDAYMLAYATAMIAKRRP